LWAAKLGNLEREHNKKFLEAGNINTVLTPSTNNHLTPDGQQPKMPPPILRDARPDEKRDEIGAAEYDMTKIVWYLYTYVDNDTLADRSSQFTNLFMKLRDNVKAANKTMKKAAEGHDQLVAKHDLKIKRDAMERALYNASIFGDEQILAV
jgi:hypothetical protein